MKTQLPGSGGGRIALVLVDTPLLAGHRAGEEVMRRMLSLAVKHLFVCQEALTANVLVNADF